MGFFDRFKKQFEKVGADKRVKYAVGSKDAKSKAEADKKRQFAAVPSGKPEKPKERPEGGSKGTATPSKRETGDAPRVLISAVVTEKSSRLSGANQVVFEVARNATKHAVAGAVRDLYGITPVGVRIRNTRGRSIRYGRTEGRTRSRRTAVVSVPEGKRITVTEGV